MNRWTLAPLLALTATLPLAAQGVDAMQSTKKPVAQDDDGLPLPTQKPVIGSSAPANGAKPVTGSSAPADGAKPEVKKPTLATQATWREGAITADADGALWITFAGDTPRRVVGSQMLGVLQGRAEGRRVRVLAQRQGQDVRVRAAIAVATRDVAVYAPGNAAKAAPIGTLPEGASTMVVWGRTYGEQRPKDPDQPKGVVYLDWLRFGEPLAAAQGAATQNPQQSAGGATTKPQPDPHKGLVDALEQE